MTLAAALSRVNPFDVDLLVPRVGARRSGRFSSLQPLVTASGLRDGRGIGLSGLSLTERKHW
jgi:hypothetical protein